MKIRLLLAVIFLRASNGFDDQGCNTTQLRSSVAIAGHTSSSNYRAARLVHLRPGEEGRAPLSPKDASPVKSKPGRIYELDFGTAVLLRPCALHVEQVRG